MKRLAIRFLAITAAAALLMAAPDTPAQESAAGGHRAAVAQYLAASRSLVAIRHFGMPVSIREAAVDNWGFESIKLGGDQILAMEAYVDAAALEGRIIELHVKHLTADQALESARFFESAAGKRIVSANVGNMLPSSDPLALDGTPQIAAADQKAFEKFMAGSAGRRLKEVGPTVTEELLRIVTEFADKAVERYVREKGLPNRRLKPGPGTG